MITLTIIGVIAALTIPNLMHKWQQKELETRFNKAYSILNQAKEQMQAENGKNCIDDYINNEISIFRDDFSKYMKTEKIPDKIMNTSQLRYKTKTYNKRESSSWVDVKKENAIYLPNNMVIVVLKDFGTIAFAVDTNGFGIAPDALGHDTFFFYWLQSDPNRLRPYGEGFYSQNFWCSQYRDGGNIGKGCAKWALLNKCADDEAKNYWECLPQ